jgi:hypothetical protein
LIIFSQIALQPAKIHSVTSIIDTMKKSIILFLSLVTIGLPVSLFLVHLTPAQAQTKSPKMTIHAIADVIFKAPSSWFDQSDDNNIVLDYPKPPKARDSWMSKGTIRTIGWSIDQDLASVVAERAAEKEGGAKAEKTEKLTIGGKPAVRLYQSYEERFVGGITTAIATGDNQTTLIITFYSDSTTEKQAQQIHQSIRVVQ